MGVVGGRIAVGVKEELMAFIFLVKLVRLQSHQLWGGRGEERREHGIQFPGVGGRGVDLGSVEGRFGC